MKLHLPNGIVITDCTLDEAREFMRAYEQKNVRVVSTKDVVKPVFVPAKKQIQYGFTHLSKACIKDVIRVVESVDYKNGQVVPRGSFLKIAKKYGVSRYSVKEFAKEYRRNPTRDYTRLDEHDSRRKWRPKDAKQLYSFIESFFALGNRPSMVDYAAYAKAHNRSSGNCVVAHASKLGFYKKLRKKYRKELSETSDKRRMEWERVYSKKRYAKKKKAKKQQQNKYMLRTKAVVPKSYDEQCIQKTAEAVGGTVHRIKLKSLNRRGQRYLYDCCNRIITSGDGSITYSNDGFLLLDEENLRHWYAFAREFIIVMADVVRHFDGTKQFKYRNNKFVYG